LVIEELPIINQVTFILPVLNRRHCIVRAVESCLRCETPLIKPHVIIIDGESDDGTYELLTDRYRDDSRVRILRNERHAGFVDACFLGVNHLPDTGFATFMYSDDVLSPYFFRLIETMADHNASISMGYGKRVREEEAWEFSEIADIEMVPAEKIILSYYGRADLLGGKALPVSPVCCIVKVDILKQWVHYISEFTKKNKLRQHAMVRLAGGQDLIVYLAALIDNTDFAFFANEYVAQLTETRKSITTTGNKEVQLLVGYWLARIWGFDLLLKENRFSLAGRCGGYILVISAYIMLLKILKFEYRWISGIFQEASRVLVKLFQTRQLLNAFCYGVTCIAVRHRIT
jgi:glycosyltransferase involved in cell wall biosynthesis